MELKISSYFKDENISYTEAQQIFKFRTRMANFGENFRGQGGPTVCPLCQSHVDSQKWSFQCRVIKTNIVIKGKYSDIFCENIPKETANTVAEIYKFREEFLNQRKIR